MQKKAAEASRKAGAGARREIVTPQRALAALRESQTKVDSEVAAAIERAMLEACGELGYRKVTIRDVIERYGGYRVQFYQHYANKAECYDSAYGTWAERLSGELMATAGASRSWRAGLRAALGEFARFVEAEPVLAKGLLVEVHVAGGEALVKHAEVVERLSGAIDGARRENKSRHSPPPVAAMFMVRAIEEAVCAELVAGTSQCFGAAVPALAQMVVGAYFGAEAGGEELAAA